MIPESSEASVGYQGYATKKKAAKAAKKASKSAKNAKPPKSGKPGGGLSRKAKAIIITCCALLLVALAAGVAYAYFMYITTDNGLVFANVYIDGINLGGKTPEEAQILLNEELVPRYAQDIVIALPDGDQAISRQEANISIDVAAIVEKAYNYGREGSRYQQYKARNAAMLTSYKLDLLDYLSVDTAAIRSALDKICEPYNIALVESTLTVTGEHPSLNSKEENPQIVVVTIGQKGVSLDVDALYTEILESFKQGVFRVEPEIVYTEPTTPDLQATYDSLYTPAVDAAYALVDGKCVVQPESYGYGFDLAAAQEQVNTAAYGDVIEIPLSYTDPEVLGKALKSMLFRDTLIKVDTYQPGSSDNRNVNLALASEALYGTVIMPGEVFSYNEVLGERTSAKGYKPAPAYSGGQMVTSVGGGVCQGASALYYCALLADFEIVERRNHTYDSSYVPLGMDATVSWGTQDFKFRNNTGYPIRIGCYAYNGGICVWIVGTDTKDYYVEMEYEIVSQTDAPIQYKTVAYNNPEGYKDGDVISAGHNAYKIKTYKLKYSKATKELLSRTYEASSTYKSYTKVVAKVDPSTIPPETEPTDPVPTDPTDSGTNP